MSKKHIIRNLIIVDTVLAFSYGIMQACAKQYIESADIDDDNPYIYSYKLDKDRRDTCKNSNSIYVDIIKPTLDRFFSFIGLILLFPLFAGISLIIYIDDPGPVFFTQKRIGKDKHYIYIHKFRSMKMSTPHDVPTHQLSDPEKYITRVGRILRKTSLDELPQIWDIFRGKMSIIGPRPALWNQKDLVQEREKYNANSVLPGLTGLAQIKGRDTLEISTKASLDGEYVKWLYAGGIKAALQDIRCFFYTIGSIVRQEGVVEGGTGNINPISGDEKIDEIEFGCHKSFNIDKRIKKRILITGAGSYIGESFKAYVEQNYPNITVDTVDMIDGSWREKSFSSYDCIFHVAGIAHADTGKVDASTKAKYYAVNTNLAIETCQKAKKSGVTQFILMSSMIIYGGSTLYGNSKTINDQTVPAPANFYGDSKWQADKGVRKLSDDNFKVAVLRPPMIYGKGSKGNYPILAKLAKKLPVFPEIHNQRSMLYIDNLCEFVSQLILSGEGGIYFPQNSSYISTSSMVRIIAEVSHHQIKTTRLFNPVIRLASYIPGKVSELVNKAFGSSIYDQKLSSYDGLDYQIVDMNTSIALTESKISRKKLFHKEQKLTNLKGKKVLLIALSGYREGIMEKMRELGADVDFINDKPNDGFICKVLGRYRVKFYQEIINRYYAEQIKLLKNKEYDYILVIRGEYTPEKTLELLKSLYPDSNMVLYMWDGLDKLNTKGIEKKWPYYDKVYTFDRVDYEAHKDEISFLPLFYYEKYLPENISDPNSGNFTYDLSFIGTGHDDRIRIVKDVMKQCENKGFRCFFYFFIPHYLVFLRNKMFNGNFKNVDILDVNFKMIPFKKLYEIYSASKCVMDVENSGQHGLTMRSFEILGLRRKYITTNKDIVNYDFYNENNILVIDRDKPEVDMSFFNKPYVMLDEEIYQKYSLGNWILEVLK